jgi:hypothetical protein
MPFDNWWLLNFSAAYFEYSQRTQPELTDGDRLDRDLTG